MAPEVAIAYRDDNIKFISDKKFDIYSLGMIFWVELEKIHSIILNETKL